MVIKPDKDLFLCAFIPFLDRVQNIIVIPYRGANQQKRAGYVTHAQCVNAKQKIGHSGPSNMFQPKPWHLCLLL